MSTETESPKDILSGAGVGPSSEPATETKAETEAKGKRGAAKAAVPDFDPAALMARLEAAEAAAKDAAARAEAAEKKLGEVGAQVTESDRIAALERQLRDANEANMTLQRSQGKPQEINQAKFDRAYEAMASEPVEVLEKAAAGKYKYTVGLNVIPNSFRKLGTDYNDPNKSDEENERMRRNLVQIAYNELTGVTGFIQTGIQHNINRID